MFPASVEYLNRQWIITKLRQRTLGATIYIFYPLFPFCECVRVCFFVWICLYSFAFTIFPRVLSVRFFVFFLVKFLALVITGGFVYWFGYSLLFLNYFLFFYFNNFFILIILFYLLFFFFLFFSLFFWAMWLTGSWNSSLVSGLSLWGGRAEFRTLDHQRPPGPM